MQTFLLNCETKNLIRNFPGQAREIGCWVNDTEDRIFVNKK
jgi:hypothetical protein